MWKFKISKRNDDSSRKLALEGNCVLTPVYPISENLEKTEKQLGKLKEAKNGLFKGLWQAILRLFAPMM